MPGLAQSLDDALLVEKAGSSAQLPQRGEKAAVPRLRERGRREQ